MTQLYSMVVTEEEAYYLWKGVPADQPQRPMTSFYQHCSTLGKLKSTDKGLYDLRQSIIKKWFSAKDSSHANIYRHYQELKHW